MTIRVNILSARISFDLRSNKPAISVFRSAKVHESDGQHEEGLESQRERSREALKPMSERTLTDEKSDAASVEMINWIAGVGDICNSTLKEGAHCTNTTEHYDWKRVDSSQKALRESVKLQRSEGSHSSKRSSLQRHCEFWDADNDGLIYPWDIYTGFRKLGFNFVLCLWAAVTMALCSSYSTQTNWLPHPLFAININNIHRSRHGSTTSAYDMDGELDMRRFDAIFEKYAQGKDYLTWKTMYNVWAGQCCANDFFGWFAGGHECKNYFALASRRQNAQGRNNGGIRWYTLLQDCRETCNSPPFFTVPQK